MVDNPFLMQSYDAFARIEEEFNDALDESLDPCGPEMLYERVAELALPAGATALDVGCGEGTHAIELAKRFRFSVVGIDPVPRHIDIARRNLANEALSDPVLADMVGFKVGAAEDLPVESGSVDLVWCRDVLVHVDDLAAAYTGIRQALRPRGHALVYQMFSTEQLESREAAWLLPTMGCVPANMSPAATEEAIRVAGLEVKSCLVLGTEWGEYAQERTGRGGRKLLHAARLLRDPARYVRQYGRENYDIALGDCLWHIYRLIGKLSDRVYLVSPTS